VDPNEQGYYGLDSQEDIEEDSNTLDNDANAFEVDFEKTPPR